MSRYLYALLVGINNYPDPAHRLSGCVNDMDGWMAYFSDYAQKAGYTFKPLLLYDEAATRQAIVSGFVDHLAQAQKRDLAVFCFAGHGSEMPGQAAFGQRPEEKNQTLVCWDSRTPGHWDLVDKELSNLVARVAQNDSQTTLILDCCHSGSGSREQLWEEKYKERRIEPQLAASRPSRSFISADDLVVNEGAVCELSGRSMRVESAAPFTLKKGRHILLAACHETQTSKEMKIGNASRGVFSLYMQQVLDEATRPLTYAELIRQVQHEINQQKIPKQVPQLEVIHGEEGDTQCYFLSRDKQTESDGIFTLSYQDGWVVDGGAVHGWTEGVEESGIELAVFPFANGPKAIKQGQGQQLAIAGVQSVQATCSRVSVVGEGLEPTQLYRAVVTKMPMADELTVLLQGNEAGVKALRLSLAELDEKLVKVREVQAATEAMVVLKAAEREYEIFRGAALQEPMAVPVASRRYCPPLPTDVGEVLVRVWRWLALRNLYKGEQRFRAGDIEFGLFQKDRAGNEKQIEGSDLQLNCEFREGRWLVPDVQFQIRNNTIAPIYCAVLYLSPEYGISPDLIEAGGLWVEPGDVGRSIDFDLAIPKVFVERGVTEYPTIFKVIASNKQFNARIWNQEDIGKAEREIIPKRKKQEFWITKEVVVRCVVPSEATTNSESQDGLVAGAVDSQAIGETVDIAELWAMDEMVLLAELGRLAEERSPVVTERPIESWRDYRSCPAKSASIERGKQMISQVENSTWKLLNSSARNTKIEKSPCYPKLLMNSSFKYDFLKKVRLIYPMLTERFGYSKYIAKVISVLLVKQISVEFADTGEAKEKLGWEEYSDK